MKNKKLLSISLLCLFGMIVTGCTNGGSKSSAAATSNPASEGGTSEVQPASSDQGGGTTSEAPVDPTGVTLDKATASIIKGQTLQLNATVAPANANNKEITWSSNDEDVVTVSKTGLVTAVEVGYAKVTAKIKNTDLKAECDISVIKQINSIAISNKSAFDGFIVDDSDSLNIEIDPADNATALLNAGVLKVTSSDTAVAAISGLTVTALKAGSATIKAELFGKSDEFQLTVGEAIPGVKKTVLEALTLALTEAPSNNSSGKDRITTTAFELTGKVLAAIPNGATGYNAILDDGTAAVYLQISKLKDDPIPLAAGDYAKVTAKLQNYYGMYEGVSRKAKSNDNASWIPSKDVEKIAAPETPITPTLAAPVAMTGDQYNAYYDLCVAAAAKNATTYSELKYVTLTNIEYSEALKAADQGSYKCSDKYAISPIGNFEMDEPFDGQKSTVDCFLIGVNSSKKKSNAIVVAQTPLAPTSVSIVEEAQTIVHGFELPLTYKTEPAGSYARDVEWTSSDETTATVSAEGVVKGIYVGTGTKVANIKVKLGQGDSAVESAIVAISVFGEDVAATAVDLAATANVFVGETIKLSPVTTPAMVSDIPVWSSADETIAKVDQKGVVSGIAEGTVNITVKYNDTVSKTCAVTVAWEKGVRQSDPLTVDEAIVITNALENKAKTTKAYFVKGFISEFLWDNFDKADKNNATFWLASSTASQGFEVYGAIAHADLVKTNVKVGAEVLVGGIFTKYGTTLETSSGEATIYSATWEEHPATAISLDKATAEMVVGDQLTLKVGYTPFYATDDKSTLAWGSDNNAVATVSKGVISAVRPGTAKITAKLGNLKAECTVTVAAPGVQLAKVAAYDFSTGNEATTGYDSDAAGMLKRFNDNDATGEGLSDIVTGVSGISKCYAGQSGYLGFGMKFGTSSVNGTFTLALSKSVSKVVVVAAGWTATDSLKVGDADAQTPGVAYNADGAFKTLTFNIASSNSVSFVFAKRGFIKSIEFYAPAGESAPVEQPVGTFRGVAKLAAGTFAPVEFVLAADSAAVKVNEEAVTVTSYEWNNKDTLTIVTDGAYGTITAMLEDGAFYITNISGQARAMVDMSVVIALFGDCTYLDLEAMDQTAISATFLRRYDRGDGNGWQTNGSGSDKLMLKTTEKFGNGVQCNGFADGKIGFNLKNDLSLSGAKVKGLSCWVYNPSEADVAVRLFIYKAAGFKSAQECKSFTLKPGWNFCQCGLGSELLKDTETLYNFQFFLDHKGVNLIYDNLCIYKVA